MKQMEVDKKGRGLLTDYDIILSGSLHLRANAIAKAHAPIWRCELADILSRAYNFVTILIEWQESCQCSWVQS